MSKFRDNAENRAAGFFGIGDRVTPAERLPGLNGMGTVVDLNPPLNADQKHWGIKVRMDDGRMDDVYRFEWAFDLVERYKLEPLKGGAEEYEEIMRIQEMIDVAL